MNITITTTPAEKLERTRASDWLYAKFQLPKALLDYETAEGLQRTLSSTMRELEELTITISIMERKTTISRSAKGKEKGTVRHSESF